MIPMRKLGRTGPEVSAIGLGAMGFSGVYAPADRAESIATIAAALDAGINLIDTGDFYGTGHNELLIAEALRERRRDEVVLSVKFGALRDPAGTFIGFDARPAIVKNALAHSLNRLGTNYVDVYRPARLDQNVPIEETIGAIAEMVQAGYVRHIGLSEVSADTIRRANAVHPIVDLQIEYSLLSRSIEESILPACRELGIAITAYAVLSRGLIGGAWSKASASPSDFRLNAPRFQGENLDKNVALLEALKHVAEAKRVTVAQIAVAWVLHRGDDIIPLVGSRTRAQLTDSLGALDVRLEAAELAAIEAAIPKDSVAGERYNTHGMASLDSERGAALS
jgi:aryl-alcohol dehydrogenase-like predicted oxidoreductase